MAGVDWFKPELKEVPKIYHRFESAIGYCPECKTVESKNLDDFLKHLKDARKLIDEHRKNYKYLCSDCGFPLAPDSETARAMNGCPWCGSDKAVDRRVYEEKKKAK